MGESDVPETRWTLREALLGSALGYRAFKVLTRGDQTMQRMTEEYVRPAPGERVLDVGCGYGDLADHMGDVSYQGIDLNSQYITFARRRHNDESAFIVGDVTELAKLGIGPFDCAVMIGVLHHLSDADCTSTLQAVSTVLTPNGRFVAAEPTWDPDQRTTARVLAALDRGRYVRERSRYEELVSPFFGVVDSEVRHDLFWFPYTHCMITANLEG